VDAPSARSAEPSRDGYRVLSRRARSAVRTAYLLRPAWTDRWPRRAKSLDSPTCR
jgi:hypothetical protein